MGQAQPDDQIVPVRDVVRPDRDPAIALGQRTLGNESAHILAVAVVAGLVEEFSVRLDVVLHGLQHEGVVAIKVWKGFRADRLAGGLEHQRLVDGVDVRCDAEWEARRKFLVAEHAADVCGWHERVVEALGGIPLLGRAFLLRTGGPKLQNCVSLLIVELGRTISSYRIIGHAL